MNTSARSVGPLRSSISKKRWEWMAGSSAALGAAATGTAMAAPVQITLTGNQVSRAANNINADITGDGVVDLPSLNVFVRSNFTHTNKSHVTNGRFYYSAYTRVGINSGTGIAAASVFAGKRFGIASHLSRFTSNSAKSSRIDSNASNPYYAFVGSFRYNGGLPQSATREIPVTFSDSRFNFGKVTSGFLTVRAFNASAPDFHVVQFVSLTYEDVSATLRLSIKSKIKKLKKRLKKAKRSKRFAKVKKIKSQIKLENRKLKA